MYLLRTRINQTVFEKVRAYLSKYKLLLHTAEVEVF